ncbi:MAG TPA: citrate lyase subunit alpha [Firmicutes bacterium]|nr:citrate lyase subunit alpha [Candidatus Fermentithermobacillaceae bacterium]
MAINAVGREVPTYVEGLGEFRPYAGVFATPPKGRRFGPTIRRTGGKKLLPSLRAAIEASGLKDGMTISFHHHFRNGDLLVNRVVNEIAAMGIKDLTLAASSLQSIHKEIIPHIRSGVITAITTSGLRGELAEVLSREVLLKAPVMIRSHGGRVRAIESGELKIDVAFIAAPNADEYGNLNGINGPTACGSLGYAFADAQYAECVVAVTDTLVPYPAIPISIPQTQVDYVVVVDKVGDPQGIMSGVTRLTRDPMELLIAEKACRVIEASGLFREGFSFQVGAGGSSLAVARFLRERMAATGVRGRFATGGITGYIVGMLKDRLIDAILDTQCFDLVAVESLRDDPRHVEMSASFYANPHTKTCTSDILDIMMLGATEIDLDFNVNVMTGSDGIMMGASGGHPDTAAGAKLRLVTAPLIRGRFPIVVDRVHTVVTPGECIDALVTQYGVAVNPRNPELKARLKDAGIDTVSIEELQERAERLTGKPEELALGDEIVALIEYRDGTLIDTVRRVI